jgi:hypothetical protein
VSQRSRKASLTAESAEGIPLIYLPATLRQTKRRTSRGAAGAEAPR